MELHFKAHPRLLDSLGLALYHEIPRALFELVANAWDADSPVVDIEVPRTWTPSAILTVRDEGEGMNRDDVEDKFLYLGYNRREDRPLTKNGRLPMGNKGIG